METNESIFENHKIYFIIAFVIAVFLFFYILGNVLTEPSKEKVVAEHTAREAYGQDYLGKKQSGSGVRYLFAFTIFGLVGYLIFKYRSRSTTIFLIAFASLMVSIIFDDMSNPPTSREGNLFLGLTRMLGIVGMIAGGIFYMFERNGNNESAEIQPINQNNSGRNPIKNLNRCPQCYLVNRTNALNCIRCGSNL